MVLVRCSYRRGPVFLRALHRPARLSHPRGDGCLLRVGCYFDWQKAVYPSTKTFNISTLSDAELERFKTEIVRPGSEQACKAEALKTVGFDGKLPTRAASQCECFATNFATRLTRADMIAFEKDGRYPDDLQQRVGTEVRRACQN